MTTLEIPVTTDFTGAPPPAGTTAITFLNGASTVTGFFLANQFDGDPIATTALITGSAGINALTVSGGSVNASAWQFQNWLAVDKITLNGGKFADNLVGSSQIDTLNGLIGADALRGGLAADVLNGGDGNDVFVYGASNELHPGEVIAGGNDTDTIRITAPIIGDFTTATISAVEILELQSDATARLASGQIGTAAGRIATVIGGTGQNRLIVEGPETNLLNVSLTGVESVLLQGTTGDDLIIGSDQADFFAASLGQDLLAGGGGDDSFLYDFQIFVEAGDQLFGGGGSADTLILDNADIANPAVNFIMANTTINGIEKLGIQNGNAEFLGTQLGGASGIAAIAGSADDTILKVLGPAIDLSAIVFTDWTDVTDQIKLIGTAGADTLKGSGFQDKFSGGGGADSMIGGGGADVFDIASVTAGLSVDGGTGIDLIKLTGGPVDFTGATLVSIDQLQYQAVGAPPPAIAATFSGAQLGGASGIARIINNSTGFSSITVRGAAIDLSTVFFNPGWNNVIGAVTLQGTTGVDSIIGSSQRDSATGGAGADRLRGGGDNDVLNGGNDGDRLDGDGGDDTLNGDAGADTFTGGEGADTISGGSEDDTVFAQGGNDTAQGGTGNDTIYGGDEATGGDVSLKGDAGNDHIQGGLGDDRIDGGADSDQLFGEGGADNITGGAGIDRLEGGGENDLLQGQDGDDVMTGGAGGDVMTGGQGVDRLDGNDGDDSLDGGTQNDNLTGGLGADTYNFEALTASDAVFGFEDNIDTLKIDPSYGFANVAAVQAAASVSAGNIRIILNLATGDQVFLMGYAAAGGSIASLADDILIG